MFIQPQVTLESGESVLLDDVIGANFAIIGWGCNPQWGLDAGQIALLARDWRALYPGGAGGANPSRKQDNAPGTLRVGDTQNRLKSWFAQHNTAIAVVRPDRFVVRSRHPADPRRTADRTGGKMTLATGDTARTEEKVA